MKNNANLKKLLLGLTVLIVVFLILFIYTAISIQLVEYGYILQELRKKEFALSEEIDRLKAQKASLTNLYQVERIALEKLHYNFPEPDQVIKIFIKKDEKRN